jgi:hypothetical protein
MLPMSNAGMTNHHASMQNLSRPGDRNQNNFPPGSANSVAAASGGTLRLDAGLI